MDKTIIDVHVQTLLLFIKDKSNEEALYRLNGMKTFGQFTKQEYLEAINKVIAIVEDKIINHMLVGDPD